jgi:hypothetical protein
MTLESMRRRIEEAESAIEPNTITVRLKSGEEREYSKEEVYQAMHDASIGNDTPLLREISEVKAYRNDEAGLAGWIQLATTIRHSRQLHGTLKAKSEGSDCLGEAS